MFNSSVVEMIAATWNRNQKRQKLLEKHILANIRPTRNIRNVFFGQCTTQILCAGESKKCCPKTVPALRYLDGAFYTGVATFPMLSYRSIMSPIVFSIIFGLTIPTLSWLHLHHCDDCHFRFKKTFRRRQLR